MDSEPYSVTDLNFDTVFKVAWAYFMKMGELTYIVVEAKKVTFAKIGLTRLDISFAEKTNMLSYIINKVKLIQNIQRYRLS